MVFQTELDLSKPSAAEQADRARYEALAKRVRAGEELSEKERRELRALEDRGADRRLVGGFDALAAATGKSSRTLKRWRDAGMPVERIDEAGQLWFDVDRVLVWRKATPYRDGRAASEDDEALDPVPEGGSKADWERRFKREQAELYKLRREKMAGDLVSRREVGRMFAQRVLVVKTGLLSLERSLPPKLEGLASNQERAEVIGTECRALLERYAAPLPEQLQAFEADDVSG